MKIAGEDNLCDECREEYEKDRIDPGGRELLTIPDGADKAYASYYYQNLARQAIINAKFRNPASFLNSFTKDIYYDIEAVIAENDIDCITPVPPYKDKFYRQEYDLPTEMAKRIAEEFNIKLLKSVRKVRKTGKQHSLSREQRKANLVNAFQVTENLNGRNILLIDDVFTTGSTLSAVARRLKRAGAKSVTAWTYTRNTNERDKKNGKHE